MGAVLRRATQARTIEKSPVQQTHDKAGALYCQSKQAPERAASTWRARGPLEIVRRVLRLHHGPQGASDGKSDGTSAAGGVVNADAGGVVNADAGGVVNADAGGVVTREESEKLRTSF
jgi:hypothetical protein